MQVKAANGKVVITEAGKIVLGRGAEYCCTCRLPNKCYVCTHQVTGRGCKYSKESVAEFTLNLPVRYSDGTVVSYAVNIDCHYAGVFLGNPRWVGYGSYNSESSVSSKSSSSSRSSQTSSASSASSKSSDSLSSTSAGQSNSSASSPSSGSSKSSASYSSKSEVTSESSFNRVVEQVTIERVCRTGDQYEWRIQIQTESLRNSIQTCSIILRLFWVREVGAHCLGINTDEMFGATYYNETTGIYEQNFLTFTGSDIGIYSGGFGSTEIAAPMGILGLSGEPSAEVRITGNRCRSKQLCGDLYDNTLCDTVSVDGIESGSIDGNGITTQNNVLPRDGWFEYQKYNLKDVFYSTGEPVDEFGNNYWLPYSVSALDLGKTAYENDCNWYFTATHLNPYPGTIWAITWRSLTEKVGGTYVPWTATGQGLGSGPSGYGYYYTHKYFPAYQEFTGYGFYSNMVADAGNLTISCDTGISSYDSIYSKSSDNETSSSQTYESQSSKSSYSSASTSSASSQSSNSSSSSANGSESTDGQSESTDGGGGGGEDSSASSNPFSSASSVSDLSSLTNDPSSDGDSLISVDPELSSDIDGPSSQSGSFAECCNYNRVTIAGLDGFSARLDGQHSLRHDGPDDSKWESYPASDFNIVMRAPSSSENITGNWEVVLTDVQEGCTVVWINNSTALCPPTVGWALYFSSCANYVGGPPTLVLTPCTQAEWSSSSSATEGTSQSESSRSTDSKSSVTAFEVSSSSSSSTATTPCIGCCTSYTVVIAGTPTAWGINGTYTATTNGIDYCTWDIVWPGAVSGQSAFLEYSYIAGAWSVSFNEVMGSPDCHPTWTGGSGSCPPTDFTFVSAGICGDGEGEQQAGTYTCTVTCVTDNSSASSNSSSSQSGEESSSTNPPEYINCAGVNYNCEDWIGGDINEGYLTDCALYCCLGITYLGFQGTFAYNGNTYQYTKTNDFHSTSGCRKYLIEMI